PVLHGGGQESDIRSGTLDAPAIRGFATAAQVVAKTRDSEAIRLAALRDDMVARVLAAVPDAVLNGAPPGPGRLPGNAHFSFPGCEGDALLMLLDARGIACSTGSACTAGVARPSHVLLAMGADEAMAGGVDSAVAAARAADAGHEVTGVHLALSANPRSYRTGARGCCTLEDARDARRAADVIGIPFYVWDMAERFHRDVVADFVAEYAAGRTPNPCLRCNEKIKFAAVLDRAVALGFDAVCTGHHARLDYAVLR